MLAIVILLGLGIGARHSPCVRRHLVRRAHRVARNRREASRLAQLRSAGPVRKEQYVQLRDLVEDLERTSPSDASRFELQELLDNFVRLSVSLQRCHDGLRLANDVDTGATTPAGTTALSPRRQVAARRRSHREECLRRSAELSDEIGAIDELVRLFAQRGACQGLELEHDGEIEKRLDELDDHDAALRQLSA